ncbi:MAG: spermidine synthase [Gemmataceae bacterium]|nr:spermidine synthase [Gemmataceae bacterium]
MGSSPSAPALPFARLAWVGAVVFLANAALLVLQLVASRLLAPFIGSDLYSWTAIIGVFLAGIALGNAYGGKLADRYPSPRALIVLLAAGAVAAVWMAVFPMLLTATGVHRSVPLGPRIPLLATVLCLPAGLVLSLLTPLAIKLGLPDVTKTGRVTGMVFGLGTLGCLLGNYVTGFYLVPAFTINTLVFVAAGALLALAAAVFVVLKLSPPAAAPAGGAEPPGPRPGQPAAVNPFAFRDVRRAFAVVFLASFCGMTLELTASRLIAQHLGVSLYTWTGIIGVMLAGTALGNLVGGVLADRANKPGGLRRLVAYLVAGGFGVYTFGLIYKGLMPLLATLGVAPDPGIDDSLLLLFVALAAGVGVAGSTLFGARRLTDEVVTPRSVLAGTLIAGGTGTVLTFIATAVVTSSQVLVGVDIVGQVLGWTFALFFLPMFVLGMVSPQVIRLAVPDVAHAGRVAGRVYAWSTAGAIAGTFATGYVLVSGVGVYQTILLVSLVLTVTSLAVAPVWKNNVMLYALSIVLGGVTGGFILTARTTRDESTVAVLETNYYTIKVSRDPGIRGEDGRPRGLKLILDLLVHSSVDPDDPTFLHYEHEHIQVEFLRAARGRTPNPKVLVIGGGGYTFPRCAKTLLPETEMDVVEIDPGVTRVAYQYLGLKREYGIRDFNMDGRQFVAERAAPHSYDLIVQDAVNDLSVPAHLLTKEYNDEVKAALTPDGVYLLTVIDEIEYGKLWRAAMATLRQTFPHVALLSSAAVPTETPPAGLDGAGVEKWEDWKRGWPLTRQVYVICASGRPLDVADLRERADRAAGFNPKVAAVVGAAGAVPAAPPFHTQLVRDALLAPFLEKDPGVILTDQYAPVDNLMADVFRRRRY